MQSSTVTLVRALVMFACLVAIPLIAVFGSSLPAEIVEFIDCQLAQRTAQADQVRPPAPPFASEAHSPLLRQPSAPAVSEEFSLVGSPSQLADPVSTVDRDGSFVPLSDTSSGYALDPEPTLQPAVWSETHTPELVPVVRRPLSPVPTSQRLPGKPSDSSLAQAVSNSSGSTEPFVEIEERLRELGATYYLLELWGSDRQMYRFYCKMAIAGNPHFTRYFEETDADPVQAMASVLEQVEAWRNRQ